MTVFSTHILSTEVQHPLVSPSQANHILPLTQKKTQHVHCMHMQHSSFRWGTQSLNTLLSCDDQEWYGTSPLFLNATKNICIYFPSRKWSLISSVHSGFVRKMIVTAWLKDQKHSDWFVVSWLSSTLHLWARMKSALKEWFYILVNIFSNYIAGWEDWFHYSVC